MIQVIERSLIPSPAEQVWDWFTYMDRHYLQWHPEHLAFRNIRGNHTTQGSVIFFDENLGPYHLPMQCRIVETVPERYLRYEGLFPHSLIHAGGWFKFEPEGDRCWLVADVHIGWAFALSPLLDRVIRSRFPVPELRRHMHEEGENLARILAPSETNAD